MVLAPRIRALTLTALGVATLTLGLTVSASATSATTLPGQVITVEAATSLSRVAVLRTWRLTSEGRYVQEFPAVVAFVGVNGVRPTREGLGRTPVGVFTLTQAFGNEPNDGTRLPYTYVGPDDWWDENPASANYNRLVRSAVSPGGDSENLYYSGHVYAHAVVINYNTDPVVKGAGSGFFLHISSGAPTEGCVAIPEANLIQIMRWLEPSHHPVISINVGAKALAPVEITSPSAS
ncbi:MAG TPA: L,D-transpeptidase family protein [Acidimicrobiales bacterium]|nr:L,D-transpeptidase family protein [Acidimicrobiales bacterium]